jgi:hypothetical protein
MAEETHVDADELIRELVLSLALDGIETPHQVGEFPGSDLEKHLPYIAIEVVTGTADYFEQEPIIDVDVFASSRAEAKKVAGAIQLAFLQYPWSVQVAGRNVTIDEMRCNRLPVKLPWEDPEIRRQSATYQFSARR